MKTVHNLIAWLFFIIGDVNEAIKYLYPIRNDAQFGKEATILIIEICIHSDSITTSNNNYSIADSSNQDSQRF